MSSLELDQLILDRAQYAAVRAPRRRELLAVRAGRRVQIGPVLVLEFENEQTLHYQVQEMIYAESITSEAAAGEEIATYQRLLPTATSVSATLFLEFSDLETVHADLDELAGIQHLVRLQIGDDVVAGIDVPPPDEGNDVQTYSVHFLRFDISAEQRTALAQLTVPATLSVEHPKYAASVPVPAQLRAELIADLAAAAN